MSYQDYFAIIQARLPLKEVCVAAMEECAELAQALAKMHRITDGTNPTHMTYEQARRQVIEEFADLLFDMELLKTHFPEVDWNGEIQKIRETKTGKYCKRLEGDE